MIAAAGLTGMFLVGGLLSGRVEIALLAAPFAIGLAAALAGTRAPSIIANVHCPIERCLEGDSVPVTVTLSVEGSVGEVEIAVVLPSDLDGGDAARRTLRVRGDGRVVHEMTITA